MSLNLSANVNRTVYRYRIYCNTEASQQYVWSTSTISQCPNNNTHSVDTSSITIVDQISNNQFKVTNLPLTPFNEVKVTSRTTLLDLKSINGITTLRDNVSTAGTGSITNVLGDSEYKLSISAATDVANLTSKARASYVAGYEQECGIGIRIPTTLSNNQTLNWGLFDSNNGYYFGYTGNVFSVNILNNNRVTSIPQSNFNIDTMDGTGPSQITLNPASGNIFKILYTWYGYGSINFGISRNSLYNENQIWLMHRYTPTNTTSSKNPNLPITVNLKSNGTAALNSVYVAGRQNSIIGQYLPNKRINSIYNSTAFSAGAAFAHILSFRRKTNYLGIGVSINSLDINSANAAILEIYAGTTLSASTWTNIPDQTATESCVQCTTVTATVTGGTLLYTCLSSGSSTTDHIDLSGLSYYLSEYEIITIVGRRVATTGNVYIVVRVQEEW